MSRTFKKLLLFKWSQAQVQFFLNAYEISRVSWAALLKCWFRTDLGHENSTGFYIYMQGRQSLLTFLTVTGWSRSTSYLSSASEPWRTIWFTFEAFGWVETDTFKGQWVFLRFSLGRFSSLCKISMWPVKRESCRKKFTKFECQCV